MQPQGCSQQEAVWWCERPWQKWLHPDIALPEVELTAMDSAIQEDKTPFVDMEQEEHRSPVEDVFRGTRTQIRNWGASVNWRQTEEEIMKMDIKQHRQQLCDEVAQQQCETDALSQYPPLLVLPPYSYVRFVFCSLQGQPYRQGFLQKFSS